MGFDKTDLTLALEREGRLLQLVPSKASAVLVPISASHTGFTFPSPNIVPPVITMWSSIVTAHDYRGYHIVHNAGVLDYLHLVSGTGQGHLHSPGLLSRVVRLHLVRDCVVIAVVTWRN